MTVERLVKRTVYVATCPTCGDRRVVDDKPPRETLCKCGTWVRFEPESWTGPDTFEKGQK